jgi:Sulfotransferase family
MSGGARRADPNFFIVGAARCGTTSLFAALSRHGDIYCCPVKEPNYFAFDLTGERRVVLDARRQGILIERPIGGMLAAPRVAITTDYAAYLGLFDRWSGQKAVGEASTSYLPSRVAAREIAGRFPEARIIVVLRDPVARAHSEYLMHRQIGSVRGTFREAIAPELAAVARGARDMRGMVLSGLYARQVERYLAHFRREQILFLLFDELARRPRRVLEKIFHHLGVDPGPARTTMLHWENKSRAPRFPGINALAHRTGARTGLLRVIPRQIRHGMRSIFYVRGQPVQASADESAALAELFRDDVAATARLTGLDLSHWLSHRLSHPLSPGR